MVRNESRTLVRKLPPETWNRGGLFELCIDEAAGCNLDHRHDYGHDFPMTQDELTALKEQIEDALKLKE